MNVFVIPSWYPSEGNWLNGIFIKEQTLWIAEDYPAINFGISLWGQNDDKLLLHTKMPFSAIQKLIHTPRPFTNSLKANVCEYFHPAYSFHYRIKEGNIKAKISSCFQNLKKFETTYGKVDLIHAHVNYPAGYIAYELSKRLDIPYLITEHMSPFPQKYHLNKEKELRNEIAEAMLNASSLIAVSSYLKERIKDTLPTCNPIVIPNFICTPKNIDVKKNENLTFCYANSIAQNKGIKELLEAWSLLENQNCLLKIAGTGPYFKEAQQFASSLTFKNSIEWLGQLSKEEVMLLMQKSHCHILTSYSESFGVAYIEAMAAGIPSIAAPFGGPKDIIKSNTGVFTKDIRATDIAEKIQWFIENRSRFNTDSIISEFKEKYSVVAVAPSILKLYEDAINSR
ncbi:glycosyltransferase family 4 protein [Fulvivirga sediminis]|uniref:Glycosyltransferase family 4 protein n=1 Tax=Fulvivirga sediminis TaxID=2803949 RepID=A0A937F9H9_9BACT|nr:glycosyltransferase family 4 protein [Fulvivirga sediminis]MBL3656488.1 glycosyltransferase family 4 protein [Fulvivirga sediminis]